MKNLNEPPKREKGEAEVIPFGRSTGGVGEMLPKAEADALRSRWSTIQANFVDDPRHAVQDADKLVDTVIKRVNEGFSQQRSSLEEQWSRGEQASTEDLRQALHRYREFFSRLLSM
jgi:hypothetical protein